MDDHISEIMPLDRNVEQGMSKVALTSAFIIPYSTFDIQIQGVHNFEAMFSSPDT